MSPRAPTFLAPLMLALCMWPGPVDGAVPLGAQNAVPLSAGVHAPDALVKTVDGSIFSLGQAFASKPTVLLFYRGGWCPFCNRQLAGIQEYEQKFVSLGYQILAVCTDRPEDLRSTMDKDGLRYTLLSDRSMAASSAFRVAYQVTEDDAKKYASYNIALPEVPGEPGKHWLPVPSIFVIDQSGIVRFAESNPDYRVRPPAEEILAAAAKAINAQSAK